MRVLNKDYTGKCKCGKNINIKEAKTSGWYAFIIPLQCSKCKTVYELDYTNKVDESKIYPVLIPYSKKINKTEIIMI